MCPLMNLLLAFTPDSIKIFTLDMTGGLKGHLLLRQSRQDGHDRNITIGSAGGDYLLQSLSTRLRSAYRSERPPSSSVATSRASRHRSFQWYPQRPSRGPLGSTSNELREHAPSSFPS